MQESSVVLLVIFVSAVAIVWVALKGFIKAMGSYQQAFTEKAENNLERMFLFFDYRKMFFTNVFIVVIVPLATYLLSQNVFYTLVSLVGVLVMPKLTLIVLAKRRREAIVSAIPDALSQISGSMRSGSTFSNALDIMVSETKGPIGQEFGLVLKEQKLGISQRDALENLAERINIEEMDLVVAAALISIDVGGNLAETFERLSSMLRRKIEMEGKIKALTAQGKMQGIVVALLPFAIMLALTYVQPESIMPMFSTILGWGFLAIIVVLEILGGLMIKKIVTIDV